jgi:glycosyltransferase involved in cell wall biosynthesis
MKDKTFNLSIIIPCFNESTNIKILLKKLKTIIDQRSDNVEVIVVDGGSTDNTPKELNEIFESLPNNKFKVIYNKRRKGYGSDVMQALSKANGEILSWTHADLQTDPLDIFIAYDKYKSKFLNGDKIFLKGKRKNRKFIDKFFTFGMEIVTWYALKIYLSDINAQPKIFSRFFYNNYLIKGYPNDFSLDLFALYKAKSNGFKILTIPVYFKKRMYGKAKGGGGSWALRIQLVKRTFKYIVQQSKDLNKF